MHHPRGRRLGLAAAQRIAFANDVRRELLAVSARTNEAKEADGPADWMPPWRRSRCD